MGTPAGVWLDRNQEPLVGLGDLGATYWSLAMLGGWTLVTGCDQQQVSTVPPVRRCLLPYHHPTVPSLLLGSGVAGHNNNRAPGWRAIGGLPEGDGP